MTANSKLIAFLNGLNLKGIDYKLEQGVHGTIVHYEKGARFFSFEDEAPELKFTVDNPDIKE